MMLAADIARVDAVLGERLGAGRVLGQEHVAVVVEITDDGCLHLLDDLRDCARGLVVVDGDTDQLAARGVERIDLGYGAGDIGRVRIGHGLDDDGPLAADLDAAHVHHHGLPALGGAHGRRNIPRGSTPAAAGEKPADEA